MKHRKCINWFNCIWMIVCLTSNVEFSSELYNKSIAWIDDEGYWGSVMYDEHSFL